MKIDTATFKPNSADIAAEVVEGEAVVINVATGIYYSTEGIGGWIWECASKGFTFRQIVAEAARTYAVTEDRARADGSAFLDEAIREGLLIEGEVDSLPQSHIESEQVPAGREPYAAPRLIVYRDMKDLLALDPPMPNIDSGRTPIGAGATLNPTAPAAIRARPMALTKLLRYGQPCQPDTDLLRACLWREGTAGAAFGRWLSAVGDPIAALLANGGARRRLVPLLARQMTRGKLDVPREFGQRVRAAALHETKRSAAFEKLTAQVLAPLVREGIIAVLSRGPALAHTAYETADLRHCHDLDLVVVEADAGRAKRILMNIGLIPDEMPSRPENSITLRHSSGLPVKLHVRLLDVPGYEFPTNEIIADAQRTRFYGANVLVPAPHDLLVHIIVHAATNAGEGDLVWAADAWHLLAASPNLDWQRLMQRARGKSWAALLPWGLNYLGESLDLTAIDNARLQVRDVAAELPPRAQEVALLALRRRRGGWRTLFRLADDWRTRRSLVRSMIVPAPLTLRDLGTIERLWQSPLYYLTRPFLSAVFRLRRRRIAPHNAASGGARSELGLDGPPNEPKRRRR